MEYITKEKFVVIKESANEWVLSLPNNAEFPYVETLFDSDENITDWTYFTKIKNGSLIVSFELDTHSGAVLYKWQEKSEVIENDDNVVNIVVNQNNETQNNTQTINIIETKSIEIENGENFSRGVRVYQFIEDLDGTSIYQDYTNSVDILHKLRISDGKKFIKIESNIPITGIIELY